MIWARGNSLGEGREGHFLGQFGSEPDTQGAERGYLDTPQMDAAAPREGSAPAGVDSPGALLTQLH